MRHATLLTAICLVFVAPRVSFACSPPGPKFDASGREIRVMDRFEYLAEVTGEREIAVPAGREYQPTRVTALVLNVIESSSPGVEAGMQRVIFYPGVGADCSSEPRSYSLSQYPVGTKVRVNSNAVNSGFVHRVPHAP